MDAQDTDKLMRVIADTLASAGLDLRCTLIAFPATQVPRWQVDFAGADVPLLLERNAELLLALEHVGAKVLGLEPEEHDRLSFNAGGFKERRAQSLHSTAAEAIRTVRRTGKPFAFPPMSSRERRMLHLALNQPGLSTASVGEGPRRHLVVRPA